MHRFLPWLRSTVASLVFLSGLKAFSRLLDAMRIGCDDHVKIGGSVEPFGLGPLYILITCRGLQVWEIARTLQSYT